MKVQAIITSFEAEHQFTDRNGKEQVARDIVIAAPYYTQIGETRYNVFKATLFAHYEEQTLKDLVELHKELDFELYFTVREHEGKTYQRVKAYLRV